ncbi:MAG: P22 coat protein - protein 5 domain protein [Sarcina sp.]
MSVKNFIPEVWSARMLANLDKKLVFGNCVNRDYEGEIKEQGDKVKVNRIGPVTISDYTGTLPAPEELTSTQVELVIDQAKAFNFKVDDIDAAQANVKLIDKGMERAAYGIADVIDTHIASFTSQAGLKVGSTASPVSITPANAYDGLVDLGVELDEANVTKQGRFAVLPPWYLGALTKDPRFTKEYTILENGLVEGAKVAGFTLWESNNVVKSGSNYSILAGTEMAIAYAGQVSTIEAYRPESSFADALKGLWVYGAAVFEPNAICQFIVTPQMGVRSENQDSQVMKFVEQLFMNIEKARVSENSAIQSAEVAEEADEKTEKDMKKKNKNEGK